MAELFNKQAKQYAEIRPTYPPQLFQFIASHTPSFDLAWDVATGSAQAASSLAKIYKHVVATDASLKQLEFAPHIPNVRYQHTPPIMSTCELEEYVATESSVDLVSIAQALHWFDLQTFYQQAKWVLKKPHGVIAAWCYTPPQVNPSVDSIFKPFHSIDARPYWDPARISVDEGYRNMPFPFEPVEGAEDTGPFRFEAEKVMDFEGYVTYIRSWSAYQTAKEKGVELLKDDVVERFKLAWDEDGCHQKLVKFPVYLRIGKVGKE